MIRRSPMLAPTQRFARAFGRRRSWCPPARMLGRSACVPRHAPPHTGPRPRLRRDSPRSGCTDTRVPSLRSGCGNAIHRIATERSSRSSSHAPHFPRRRAPVPVGPCAVGPTGCGPLRRDPPFAPHCARSVLRSLRVSARYRLLRRYVAPTLALSPQLRSLRRSRSLRASPWAR